MIFLVETAFQLASLLEMRTFAVAGKELVEYDLNAALADLRALNPDNVAANKLCNIQESTNSSKQSKQK